jgi:steroid delta-isomerase-like uncharacterized protein
VTIEDNKAIVRRFVDDVMNARNPDAADEVCASDIVWHGGRVIGERHGVGTLKEALQHLFVAFPDFQVVSSRIIGEGDFVAATHPWHGTHTGEFRQLPPTGNEVTVSGMSMFRIADGKIAEQWWEEDTLGLTQQLGFLPGGHGGGRRPSTPL